MLWDLDHVGSSPYGKCYGIPNALGKFSVNVLRNRFFTLISFFLWLNFFSVLSAVTSFLSGLHFPISLLAILHLHTHNMLILFLMTNCDLLLKFVLSFKKLCEYVSLFLPKRYCGSIRVSQIIRFPKQ